MRMPKAFHVQAVEPLLAQEVPAPRPKPPIDFVKIAIITKNITQQLAITGGVLYGAKKVLDVAGEVAIIAAKAKFK